MALLCCAELHITQLIINLQCKNMLKCTHVHVSLASGACVLIPTGCLFILPLEIVFEIPNYISALSLVKRDWIEIQQYALVVMCPLVKVLILLCIHNYSNGFRVVLTYTGSTWFLDNETSTCHLDNLVIQQCYIQEMTIAILIYLIQQITVPDSITYLRSTTYVKWL